MLQDQKIKKVRAVLFEIMIEPESIYVASYICLLLYSKRISLIHPFIPSTSVDTIKGFIVMTDYHCGGESIRLWEDNTDTNYGGPSSIFDCQQMCAIHEECAAFNVFDNICTFWTQAPLNPYKANGLDCHIKSNGGKQCQTLALLTDFAI